MQQAQKRAVQEAWERRAPDLPIKTPEQLVMLASIIEKETGRADERSRVAAVFVNRLKQKMKLQSDPTIIYGLVGGKGTLGRPIMRSEIEQPTPYNTYVINGLPPGPIANPGRAALRRPPIRRARASSISSPTAPAATLRRELRAAPAQCRASAPASSSSSGIRAQPQAGRRRPQPRPRAPLRRPVRRTPRSP